MLAALIRTARGVAVLRPSLTDVWSPLARVLGHLLALGAAERREVRVGYPPRHV